MSFTFYLFNCVYNSSTTPKQVNSKSWKSYGICSQYLSLTKRNRIVKRGIIIMQFFQNYWPSIGYHRFILFFVILNCEIKILKKIFKEIFLGHDIKNADVRKNLSKGAPTLIGLQSCQFWVRKDG